MAGYELTAAMEGNQCLFLVGVSVAHPGNIVVERGSFEFQAGVSGFTAAQTVTVKSGASLSQWNSTQKQQATLVLEGGAKLTSNYGKYEPGKYAVNVWEGPITVQGGTVNALASGNQVTFVGKISGAGGFRGGSGGWLQFYNAANTFTDGIGQTSGGVAAWNTNSIPVQGGAVALTNAPGRCGGAHEREPAPDEVTAVHDDAPRSCVPWNRGRFRQVGERVGEITYEDRLRHA